MPKMSRNIRTQIWTNLFRFILGLLPNLTRSLKYDFYEIYRASRVCLLPMNRLLSLKKKRVGDQKRNSIHFFPFSLVFH
jgi:hypothetical protein